MCYRWTQEGFEGPILQKTDNLVQTPLLWRMVWVWGVHQAVTLTFGLSLRLLVCSSDCGTKARLISLKHLPRIMSLKHLTPQNVCACLMSFFFAHVWL